MSSVEPAIAIVGYACRLPSASGTEDFWGVLSRGECVVSRIASDRWSLNRFGHPDRNAAGMSYTWSAGQLDDVWGFDPGFFGISPREAIQIDPQQRLLLQVTWEALEHAGIRPSTLAGTETGVYIGASSVDYSNRFIVDPAAMDVQMMTGNTLSIMSNRISHIYDLNGPSFTVDTACSSSLFALHEAAEAMRTGRIDTAIVGGVNLLLSPFAFIGFSRASMLSPNGLCRAFDADGDGYVRSEGAVVFVLKTVEAAKAAGDRILGVIAGWGINANGRTNGMSLPSAEKQGALLRHVYDRFGIDPAALGFIEAHGTGTRVGDPAEATALGTVLGRERDEPLAIGSVKTNIGHLEAASGVAGLLKAQLALERGVVPPSLHFRTPNPDIPFDDLNLRVLTEPAALPDRPEPLYAGVNSFGFGGANAHVVIRQPSAEERAHAAPAEAIAPVIVSARSRDSLRRAAEDVRDRLAAASDGDAAALLNGLAWRRERHPYRMVVPGGAREDLLGGIEQRMAEAGVSAAEGGDSTPAFLFSGNGSQWAGMGLDLYGSDAAFRDSFDEVSRLFAGLSGRSLASLLHAPDLESELARTDVAQPLLFAVQVSLVSALAARGLKPGAVAGHSVGEVAAAWASGAIDLPTAVRIIHARSVHQEFARYLGTMGALLVSAEEARAAIAEAGLDKVVVAAVNSPRSITLSGPDEDLAAFGRLAKKKRWAFRKLKLDYPFHSPLIDPIREPLAGSIGDIETRDPAIPFVSTVHGREVAGGELGADYWWLNVRQPVRFSDAVERLADLGFKVFVEIGPKPILQTYVTDTLDQPGRSSVVLPTLDSKPTTAAAIVARVVESGGLIDDAAYFGPRAGYTADLPSYPWHNERYRMDGTEEGHDVFGHGPEHPLLGSRAKPGSGPWLGHIDPRVVTWLADHKVQSSIVFPAAGFVELALAAAAADGLSGPVELSDFEVLGALVLDGPEMVECKVEIEPSSRIVDIWTRRRLLSDEWRLNARGRLAAAPYAAVPAVDLDRPAEPTLSADALYRLTQSFGLHYGPAFQRALDVTRLDRRTLVVAIEPPAAEADPFDRLHPTVLDSAFHGLFVLIAGEAEAAGGDTTYLPVRVGRLRLHRPGMPVTAARVELVRFSPRGLEATIILAGEDGAAVASLTGVRFRAVALSRTGDEQLVFRNVLERIRRPGEASYAPALDALTARARTLGLLGEGEAASAPGALLVDAAARRLAFDLLAALGDGRTVDLEGLASRGTVPPSRLPLLYRLATAVADDGGLEFIGGTAQILECPYPDFGTLTAALVAEAPHYVAEIAALARLATDLKDRLSDPAASPILPAAVAEHLATTAPLAGAVPAALGALGRDIVADWPADRPLAVLVVGGDAPGVADTVAGGNARARIAITDPSDERVSLLKLTGARRTETLSALKDEAFDLVLVDARSPQSGAALAVLRERLAPGATLVLAASAPTLLQDMIDGLGDQYWTRTVDPSFPLGASRTAPEWAAELKATGLAQVQTLPLGTDAGNGSIVLARAPEAARAASAETSDGPVLLVVGPSADDRRAADRLSEALSTKGRSVARLSWADERIVGSKGAEPAGAGLLAETAKDVVHLVGLGTGGDPTDAVVERAMVLRALVGGAVAEPARIWVVAPGGRLAGVTGPADPVSAATWGLGRVLANEASAFEIRLVDVVGEEGWTALADEMANPGADREIVLDAAGKAVVRVETATDPSEAAVAGRIGGDVGRRLVIGRQGSLDSLSWSPVPRRALGPDEVEIEVAAAGLNFRDVMWAMGLLPEEALEEGFAGATLGMECSGVITRVGTGATRFKVGDRVIAFAPACFASHVQVAEKALARLPDTVDLTAAATIPVTFLTAYYALVELARLEAGETVLIHGGAGGVGLAAIQIALSRGARVFATAGSREKRRLLALLGVEAVFDSRSLAFEDDVMAATGGAGVDVVLNSLNGEAMERSIGCVKPFGRFIELGKRDYYANTRIGLRPFRKNVSYFGVDADQLLVAKPKLTERLFDALVEGFETGTFTPLPFREFSADRISDAFRLMQQSGHIGKILIRPPEVVVPAARAIPVRPDATYLLVGGLGGFGIATAEWLVARGARYLALNSRSGAVSEAAEEAITRMRQAGASVRVFAADSSDTGAMEAVFAAIDRTMPPLRGVFHTAMVLDDALFANLDRGRFERAVRPKVGGALVLDRLTRGRDLDLFVLYSSATTLVGNPGQANYVAANAALEAIAAGRRAEGLPGLAVAWGAISDAGYLARNTDVRAVLSDRLGKDALTAAEALEGLGRLLDAGAPDPAVAYARMDWPQAQRELPIMATPLLSGIAASIDAGSAETGADGGLAKLIEGLDAAEATRKVIEVLAGEIARILRLPAEGIDPQRPLVAIGMDSLMALELRMAAEQKLGVDIPLLVLANGATLAEIARRMVDRAFSGQVEEEDPDTMVVLEQHLTTVDEGTATVVEELKERARSVRRLTG